MKKTNSEYKRIKQSDLKGQHNFMSLYLLNLLTIIYYTVFMFGGPCHLSIFRQCSRDLIVLWEQPVYLVMEKINISEFVLLPH